MCECLLAWHTQRARGCQQCPWRGSSLLLPGHSCATLGCRVWQPCPHCPHLRGHTGGSGAKGSPEVWIFHPLGGAAAAPVFVEGFQKFLLQDVPPCEGHASLFIFPCCGSGLSQSSLPGVQLLSVCSGEGLGHPGVAVGDVTEASGSQRPRWSVAQSNHPHGQCPVRAALDLPAVSSAVPECCLLPAGMAQPACPHCPRPSRDTFPSGKKSTCVSWWMLGSTRVLPG